MHASVYKRQLEQHHQHWWFKSRRSILQAVIKKNFHENIRILDFGCGVGNNLEMLSNFGIVYAFDKKKSILNLLKKNFYTNKKIKFIKKLNNYKNYFDLIVVTDVIEHIENDEKILSFLTKLLKNPIIKNSKHKNLKLFEQKKREREREVSAGKIIITVPAYNFLYSSKDESLYHKRRYNKKNLKIILDKNFKNLIFTYYNFFLSPIIILGILFFKLFNIKFIEKVEKKGNNIINFLFFLIFSSEKFFINKNIYFPFGISLFFFGEKKSKL